MTAYYNEFDPYAAQWLRNLISAGHIAPGEVDERSITDVKAADLKGFTQCHFFAGIGGWSIAARLAGWPDDRPVWTGSCPCQPFSVAGKKKAQTDERHLWPEWYRLIRKLRPSTIFGEQVSGAIAHGWLDDVYQGLEAEGYAVGSAVLPACSVGAPHKRDRLWFVANSADQGRQYGEAQRRGHATRNGQAEPGKQLGASGENAEALAHSDSERGRRRDAERKDAEDARQSSRDQESSSMADTTFSRRGQGRQNPGRPQEKSGIPEERIRFADSGAFLAPPASGGEQRSRAQCDVGGLQEEILRTGWYSHDWHVEPAVGRVANGIQARSHKLRAYGNAIVPQVAAEFIKAVIDVMP